MFQFLLDTTDYGEPLDWASTALELEKVDDLKALFLKFELPSTFAAAAYDYIVGQYDSDFTGSIDVEIKYRCTAFEAWASVWTGVIQLRDCQINRHIKLVQVVMRDEGHEEAIKVNKNIKGSIITQDSKNGTTISAATAYSIGFFDPATHPVSYSLTRTCYRVYDAFAWLVDFMTDGAVSFDSEYFKAGGEWEANYSTRLYITTGYALRGQVATNNLDHPFISFAELFDNMNKISPVSIYYDRTGPTLYIEADDASEGNGNEYYQSGTTITIRNIKHLTELVDIKNLYANVKIGSEQSQLTEAGAFQWPDIEFYNHKEEEYWTAGTMNDEAALDLVTDWITSSNIIEDVLTNNNDEYDEDMFIIECKTGANQAENFDIFNVGAAPLVYNENLTNQAIMPRHIGGVPSSATLYTGALDYSFQAEKTGITSSTNGNIGPNFVMNYDDDSTPPNFDSGGNYDAVTNYDYTVPADGHFSFTATALVNNVTVTAGFPTIDATLSIRVNGTPVASHTINGFSTAPQNFSVTYYAFLSSGDLVDVVFTGAEQGAGPPPHASYDIADGDFYSNYLNTPGPTWQSFDPLDLRAILYRFTVPLSFTDFQAILANPRDKVTINCGDVAADDIDAWIDSVKYNLGEGRAEFQLRTSKNDS